MAGGFKRAVVVAAVNRLVTDVGEGAAVDTLVMDIGDGAAGLVERAVVVAAVDTPVTDVGEGAAGVVERTVVVAVVDTLVADVGGGATGLAAVETLVTDVREGAADVLKRAVVVTAVLPVDISRATCVDTSTKENTFRAILPHSSQCEFQGVKNLPLHIWAPSNHV